MRELNATMCEDVMEQSRNSLFRSAAKICAGLIRAGRKAQCDLPPKGWYCTRDKGHEGPCAAHSTEQQPAQSAEPCKCKQLDDWKGFHHPLCDKAPAQSAEQDERSTGICFFCGEPIDGEHESDCPQSTATQPVQTQAALRRAEIDRIAGSCMDSGRYNLFMAYVDAALATETNNG
jgi:hypothetical protein